MSEVGDTYTPTNYGGAWGLVRCEDGVVRELPWHSPLAQELRRQFNAELANSFRFDESTAGDVEYIEGK